MFFNGPKNGEHESSLIDANVAQLPKLIARSGSSVEEFRNGELRKGDHMPSLRDSQASLFPYHLGLKSQAILCRRSATLVGTKMHWTESIILAVKPNFFNTPG